MTRAINKKQAGFTMIELIVVTVIVAILASIAIPSYQDHVERSKVAEAIANLSSGRVKLEQWYLDSRTYATSPVCGSGFFSEAKYFTFSCSNLTATTYTLTATGVATKGMGGFTYTIDQSNVKTSSFTSPASDRGWVGVATCWAVKKGGQC